MTWVWPILRVLAAVIVGYGLLVFLIQRAVIYPGQFSDSPRSTSAPPEGVRQIWLETDAGPVESWLMWNEESAPRAVLLFAHGNGELIEDWLGAMRALEDHGVAVLLVEYPGYGHSAGRPRRSTVGQALVAAFDSVVDHVPAGTPVVGWGRSLGGGAISDLAGVRPLDALVLQSTFTSAAAMAWRAGAPGVLVRDRFDTEAAVAGFPGPILVMHGRRDEVIPFSHGVRLTEARAGVDFVELPCGHNDCGATWSEIVRHVTGFLTRQGW
ncbi:MAG: alpha/beta hydrolase [Longimicrobiales bacterium]